jgi:hypothetical protein
LLQGYVGNVLEPQLFGASLNMSTLAIMGGLLLWGSLWGMAGAVLSVPLLGIIKICLLHADHPLAKQGAWIDRGPPSIVHHVIACFRRPTAASACTVPESSASGSSLAARAVLWGV